MSIKVAQENQFEEILQLYRNCGAKMVEQGHHNWGDFYPTEEQIREDIHHQRLYCLVEQEEILGVVVVDHNQHPNYSKVNWSQQRDKVVVIHRLAVNIQHQNKGYAKTLLIFAEQFTKSLYLDTIRLDALSSNQALLDFYLRQGYQQMQECIDLGPPWPIPFACFEKKI